MRRLRRILTIAVVVVLLGSAHSYAYNWFGGQYAKSASGLNGSKTSVNYSSVNSAYACVIFGNAVYDGATRQLENGVYSCGAGYSVDAGCPGGPNRFVEYWTGGTNYTCYIYASATSATSYPVQITGASGSYTSYFNGSPFGFLSGFPASVQAGTWLEVATNGTCADWAATVTFYSWNYRTGTTWHPVTSASPSGSCTTIGGLSAGGTWTATHV